MQTDTAGNARLATDTLSLDPLQQLLARELPWLVPGELFAEQLFGVGPWCEQGWKLHVSATPRSAAAILARALPLLMLEGVRFKVVNNLAHLIALNDGHFGQTQVGKFITVYPADDTQAVRLAVALDGVTCGLRGPRVPTDRPLRPGSLVHYRYGSFQGRAASGATSAAASDAVSSWMLDTAGRVTDDVRLDFYWPPAADIIDPFESAGAYEPAPPRPRPLVGRYVVYNALGQSHRGGVFRAIDLGARPPRLCVLKERWHDVAVDAHGRDARDAALHEAALLARHADDPLMPRCYDSFVLGDDRYIVLEYVEGTSLDTLLAEHPLLEQGLPVPELLAIGEGAAATLAGLHARGIVFRDFKPGNLLQTPDCGYRLVDFDQAYDLHHAAEPPLGIGSPLYAAPEQYRGEPPAPADDVFAWGAFMHQLACGVSSVPAVAQSFGPEPPLPRQSVRELRPAFPAPLAAVIDRAVAWERAERYSTMQEALVAWRAAAAGVDRTAIAALEMAKAVAAPHPPPCGDPLVLARAIGDAACEAATTREGMAWWAAAEGESTFPSPDLHDGAAGIALFLVELAAATGEQLYAEMARRAASWLMGSTWGRGRAQPGFHVGEAGVGYLLLRLGELLDEPGYLVAATLRARRLDGMSCQTLDLFHGAAGLALFSTRLAIASRDAACYARATALGDLLVDATVPAREGDGCYWQVPSSVPGLASTPYLGLAHGAAGIGLVLVEIAAATREQRYLECARRAADLLLARATVDTAGAWRWPRELDDPTTDLQAHCHGAGGIGQFFVRLARLAPDARYAAAARGAGRTIAAGLAAREHSGLCHGLVGDGGLLLDLAQAFGDAHYLADARRCAGYLETFRDGSRPGTYRPSRLENSSPHLLLGAAGIGAFYLRLASAQQQPDLLLG